MSEISRDTNLSIQAENYLWRVRSRFLPGYQGVHGNCPGFALRSDKGVLLVALLCFSLSIFIIHGPTGQKYTCKGVSHSRKHKSHFFPSVELCLH